MSIAETARAEHVESADYPGTCAVCARDSGPHEQAAPVDWPCDARLLADALASVAELPDRWDEMAVDGSWYFSGGLRTALAEAEPRGVTL